MKKIAILPVTTDEGMAYRAISGSQESVGKTAGAALDALTSQMNSEETNTLVILQSLRPDRYFDSEKQQRLDSLMQRWRTARDHGQELSRVEQSELDSLIEAELEASAARAAALLNELTQ